MKEKLTSIKTSRLAVSLNILDMEIAYKISFKEPRNLMDWLFGTLVTTQSLLRKKLREEHNIHIIIEPQFNSEHHAVNGIVDYYTWRGFNKTYPSTIGGVGDTYEKALEEALLESLKLIQHGRS